MASQMDDLLGKLSAMMDEKISAALGTQESAPKAAPARATGTASKAATLKRNLDPIDVPASDGLIIRVSAANGGGLLTNGSRGVPVSVDANGKERVNRSLSRELVASLDDDVRTAIIAAMDAVDKRAHIGAHKPVTNAS